MRKSIYTVLLVLGLMLAGCSQAFRNTQYTLKEDAGWSRDANAGIVVGGSRSLTAKDPIAYGRYASWYGQGGPEAATQYQGFAFNAKTGELMSVGTNRGTGVLERFWSWLKSAFWTVLFIGLFLLIAPVILMAIPATSGIGAVLVRVIGAVTGPLGSLTEWLMAKFKYQKPLAVATTANAEIIANGEAFKDYVGTLPGRLVAEPGEGFTIVQKQVVLDVFHMVYSAQSPTTKAIVNENQ